MKNIRDSVFRPYCPALLGVFIVIHSRAGLYGENKHPYSNYCEGYYFCNMVYDEWELSFFASNIFIG